MTKAEEKTPAEEFAGWVEELKASGKFYSSELRLEAMEFICEFMAQEGVTSSELAKRLKTSRSYVSQLLEGDKNLTLDSIARVLHALGYKLKLNKDNFIELAEKDYGKVKEKARNYGNLALAA